MSRAIWKAKLQLGDTAVAVKLHSAVQDRHVRFRMLHEKDLAPVYQKLENPESKKVVDYADACKGIVLPDGHVAILSDQELDELEAEASRDIEVIGVVDAQQVEHLWFQRPYFLGQDGTASEYAALAAALSSSETYLLTKWVMRKQQYHGVVLVKDGTLVLYTLYSNDEVVQIPNVDVATDELSKKERDMAGRLLEALRDDFKPEHYRDEYREELLAYLSAKASGKAKKLPRAKKKKEATASITEMLEESLKKVSNA